MISTSSYKNWKSDKYRVVSISGDRGMGANYKGNCYPKLAPKLGFWRTWHDNIGKIPEKENNLYYIEEYYKQVLSRLDPEEIFRELGDVTLLCYEEPDEFCHRHIVSAWFELLLGNRVPEQKADGYLIMNVDKPEYIKVELERIMKENLNMRGFNSLRAWYLFDKGEKFEEKARKLESMGKDGDDYKEAACFCRCDADEAEAEYNAAKRRNNKR